MSKRWQQYVPLVGGTLIVVIVGAALIMYVYKMMHSKSSNSTRQVAQVVKIIRPPPPQETPPPPPPPPEKVATPIDPPEQAPEQAPQQALGVDADATAGGDSFGLQARPGGRDLVGTGTAPFKWYTNLMASRLQECFAEDDRLRKGSYRANLRVRVGDDGHLEVMELLGSSGSAEKDAAIRGLKHCSTGEGRPLEMPKFATIQIVSR